MQIWLTIFVSWPAPGRAEPHARLGVGVITARAASNTSLVVAAAHDGELRRSRPRPGHPTPARRRTRPRVRRHAAASSRARPADAVVWSTSTAPVCHAGDRTVSAERRPRARRRRCRRTAPRRRRPRPPRPASVPLAAPFSATHASALPRCGCRRRPRGRPWRGAGHRRTHRLPYPRNATLPWASLAASRPVPTDIGRTRRPHVAADGASTGPGDDRGAHHGR